MHQEEGEEGVALRHSHRKQVVAVAEEEEEEESQVQVEGQQQQQAKKQAKAQPPLPLILDSSRRQQLLQLLLMQLTSFLRRLQMCQWVEQGRRETCEVTCA